MKRRTLSLIVAGAMAMSLTACGGGSGTAQETKGQPAGTQQSAEESKAGTEAPSGDKKLTVWIEKVFSDDANTMMEERLKAFEKETGIAVQYEMIGATDFVTKLNVAIEAGKDVPDVVSMDTTKVLNYYPNIPCADVSALVDEINGERPYFEASYEGTKIGDVHYYVPYYSSSCMMFVRKDVLEAKNIAIPTTWEEVFAAAEAVTDPANDFYGLGMGCGENDDDDENTLRQMIWNEGGALFDKDGKITCESDKVSSMISKYAELYQAEVIPPDATTWDAGGNNSSYLAGRTAIVFNAPTLYNALKNNDENKELFEKTAVLAPPAGSANSVYMNFNRGFSIMNACQDQESASALIKYLVDRSWYDEYMGTIAPVFAPLFKDEEQNADWTGDAVNAEVLKYAQNASGYYGYPVMDVKGRAVAAKHYFTFPVGKAFNQVATQTKPVQDALKDMTRAIEDFQDQVQ